ncbi:MAG: MBL fold metallo-hydrolase [Desulfobacteraceae bacterium]|nr:MBL fold metallo-hydrolase [Desulfobacteraceae bacterium]
MKTFSNKGLDYDRAIEIADGIFWVGFYDTSSGLHCNPYLIIDGDEAVVIDGGSRPDFPTVLMKILQTGIDPSNIKALIYQHYDPDLCGSVSNYEDIIGSKDLKIISDKENNIFIRHFAVTSPLIAIDAINSQYQFSSGRTLQFIKTPYAHCCGSFVTFDAASGILFSSDIFGSIDSHWDLYLTMAPDCRTCTTYDPCPNGKSCQIPGILGFHLRTMPSEKAMLYALEQLAGIDFSIIAPQHGSIIHQPEDIITVFEKLKNLKGIGIDRLLNSRQASAELGDLSKLISRLQEK